MWGGYYPAQVMFPPAHRLDGDETEQILDGILSTPCFNLAPFFQTLWFEHLCSRIKFSTVVAGANKHKNKLMTRRSAAQPTTLPTSSSNRLIDAEIQYSHRHSVVQAQAQQTHKTVRYRYVHRPLLHPFVCASFVHASKCRPVP